MALVPNLRPVPWSTRALKGVLLTALAGAGALLALAPLFSVLAVIVRRGAEHWDWRMLTTLPPAGQEAIGGFGNAVVGTLVMVGLAGLIAAPLGILAGLWLSEFGKDSWTAGVVRFAARTLAGLPSILAGLIAYALIVLTFKSFRPVAGAVALALLMLPTIVIATEEALRQVHAGLRESSYALGATAWQTTWRVTLPAARGGIATGVLLATARGCGETAPLLFTAMSSGLWLRDLKEPAQSLAVQIYEFARRPYPNQIANAWSAALALMALALALNLAGRWLASRRHA